MLDTVTLLILYHIAILYALKMDKSDSKKYMKAQYRKLMYCYMLTVFLKRALQLDNLSENSNVFVKNNIMYFLF